MTQYLTCIVNFLAKGNVKLAIRKKGSQRLHVATDIALLSCIMALEDRFLERFIFARKTENTHPTVYEYPNPPKRDD